MIREKVNRYLARYLVDNPSLRSLWFHDYSLARRSLFSLSTLSLAITSLLVKQEDEVKHVDEVRIKRVFVSFTSPHLVAFKN